MEIIDVNDGTFWAFRPDGAYVSRNNKNWNKTTYPATPYGVTEVTYIEWQPENKRYYAEFISDDTWNSLTMHLDQDSTQWVYDWLEDGSDDPDGHWIPPTLNEIGVI